MATSLGTNAVVVTRVHCISEDTQEMPVMKHGLPEEKKKKIIKIKKKRMGCDVHSKGSWPHPLLLDLCIPT